MINTYEQASEVKLEHFSSLLVEMLPKPAFYNPVLENKARVFSAEAQTSVLQLESLILGTQGKTPNA